MADDAKVLGENDTKLFKVRIDGNNCKYLLIAMWDTKVKQVGNELKKDKSLERKENADQRTAPHATDALDKGCFCLNKSKRNVFSGVGMNRENSFKKNTNR